MRLQLTITELILLQSKIWDMVLLRHNKKVRSKIHDTTSTEKGKVKQTYYEFQSLLSDNTRAFHFFKIRALGIDMSCKVSFDQRPAITILHTSRPLRCPGSLTRNIWLHWRNDLMMRCFVTREGNIWRLDWLLCFYDSCNVNWSASLKWAEQIMSSVCVDFVSWTAWFITGKNDE